MARIADVAARVTMFLKTYPAIAAALVNIAVIVCAYFGFHVTGDQIVFLVSVASALLGILVHSHVTPTVKKPDAPVIVMNTTTVPPTIPKEGPPNG